MLQLLYVGEGAEDQLEGALRFFLSPKSAYISGQVIRLAACDTPVQDWTRPLAGRKALVTGAARGIGASIAETLARDGAEVIVLDVPQAKADLEALAARLNARTVVLDICAEDAARQLAEHLPDGLDILVHNAGITRDKTLANMTPEYWDAVLAVNLNAPQVLTKALLDSGTLQDNARVILLASISGIAGNRGQTNYAASKAGLIGLACLGAAVEGAWDQHQRRRARVYRNPDDRAYSLRPSRGRAPHELPGPRWLASGCGRSRRLAEPAGFRCGQRPGAAGVWAKSSGSVSMQWQTLDSTPSLLPLYWRAALKRKITGSIARTWVALPDECQPQRRCGVPQGVRLC